MDLSVMKWLDAVPRLVAAAPARDLQPSYIGLALLAGLLLLCLIKGYRVWQEIHDVEEPASPADLLKSFERAHFAGDMDNDEFKRVRARLTQTRDGEGASLADADPYQAPAPETTLASGDRSDASAAKASGTDVPPQPMKDDALST
jgi:hypothetical protein